MLRRLFPFLPAIGVLALAILVSVTTEVSFAQFVGDPTSVAGLPPYTGALSMLGILLWCAAATVCVFSALLLREREGTERVVRFLSGSGGLTALLMLDDTFQLHEHAALIGASEAVAYVFYVAAAVGLFWTYQDLVRASDTLLLMVAGGLFALGIGADVVRDLDLLEGASPDAITFSLLLEDGFKFLGIVGWLNYYVWACLGFVRSSWAS